MLDFSLGCVGDASAESLLGCPAIQRVESLNLQYHYISDSQQDRLEELGIPINLSEPQELGDGDARCCAISE